mmetsp:Transcript_148699/g.476209  ORF Transcript_148699/g.476209 Transcript_148699/m.476209 type:complete len:203 (+) Transcript_148699:161-769(+)
MPSWFTRLQTQLGQIQAIVNAPCDLFFAVPPQVVCDTALVAPPNAGPTTAVSTDVLQQDLIGFALRANPHAAKVFSDLLELNIFGRYLLRCGFGFACRLWSNNWSWSFVMCCSHSRPVIVIIITPFWGQKIHSPKSGRTPRDKTLMHVLVESFGLDFGTGRHPKRRRNTCVRLRLLRSCSRCFVDFCNKLLRHHVRSHEAPQ